jgi:hypothetical protein
MEATMERMRGQGRDDDPPIAAASAKDDDNNKPLTNDVNNK